jgi:threonine aldolase
MMAAAASAALDYSISRLPQVHELARRAAASLEEFGYKFALPVQTNMIVLDLDSVGIPPAAFVSYCKKNEILVVPTGRLVFHHQTSEDGVSRLLSALKSLMDDKLSGKALEDHKVTGGYMCR